MPYLLRDGVRLYYEDHGHGMPILLTHGFAASSRMWQGQVTAFQDAYRLICWDMRGHGASDSPAEQTLYSHAHTIEDMRALLDHLGVTQAVIAGHSLGGFLSLAFAIQHPTRVRALILQGCGPGYRNPKAREAWNARTEQRAQALEAKGFEAIGGSSEVRLSPHRSPAGLAKAARGILRQVDARVIDGLPQITVPVLLIVGEEDTPYLNGMNYMARRLPHAELVVIPQAGHGANVDQPEIFNKAVRQFLARS